MRIVVIREELAAARAKMRGRVGFVPTMGALHAGHLALLEAAKAACSSTIVSIFVNPTQFADATSAAAYPADTAGDVAKLEAAGCDLAWLPTVDEIYPPGDATMVDPSGPALGWEGEFRPGHFRGMATVVAKLFGLTCPDAAFFGEKDWQQLQVVRRMVADLLLPVEIASVPTVREVDGLAMSSRNRLLSAEQRSLAPRFYAVLQHVAAELRAGTKPEVALTRGRADLERGRLRVRLLSGGRPRNAAADS